MSLIHHARGNSAAVIPALRRARMMGALLAATAVIDPVRAGQGAAAPGRRLSPAVRYPGGLSPSGRSRRHPQQWDKVNAGSQSECRTRRKPRAANRDTLGDPKPKIAARRCRRVALKKKLQDCRLAAPAFRHLTQTLEPGGCGDDGAWASHAVSAASEGRRVSPARRTPPRARAPRSRRRPAPRQDPRRTRCAGPAGMEARRTPRPRSSSACARP